jgi:predicted GNAT family N-acyltransferase
MKGFPLPALETRPIRATETHKLRHLVLRPQEPLSSCIYPHDTELDTLHIGGFLDGELIGVGSILPEARQHASQPIGWRIRGMAVRDDARRTGAGSKILQALIDYAGVHTLPAEIWCNGRTHVLSFYARFGFAQEGDSFDIPGTGPHVLLIKTLLPERG